MAVDVDVSGSPVSAGSPAPDSTARAGLPADTTRLRMLALGDSYTIGQSVSEADCYPQQLVTKLCTDDQICFEEPQIVATTGWTTGNLLDALAAAGTSGSGPPGSAASGSGPSGPYQAVTLLIGVNNQFQGRSQEEYTTQLSTLLQRSIALTGNQLVNSGLFGDTLRSVDRQRRSHRQIDRFVQYDLPSAVHDL